MTERVRGETKRGRVSAVAAAAAMRLGVGWRKRVGNRRRRAVDSVEGKSSPPVVVLSPMARKAAFDEWFFFLLFFVKFVQIDELDWKDNGAAGGGEVDKDGFGYHGVCRRCGHGGNSLRVSGEDWKRVAVGWETLRPLL